MVEHSKNLAHIIETTESGSAAINENVDGGGITSHIITSVVGNASVGSFGYVDSFPTLESWSAAKSATEGSEEGEAIDEALGEVAECSENRLYDAEKS